MKPQQPPTPSLFDFRRIGPFPAWLQVAMVCGLYATTILCAYYEYRAKGTSFGFAGPAVFTPLVPIVEELVFRGWILGRLADRLAPRWAILWSSLMFGLYHLRNLPWKDSEALAGQMIYTGLVLGPILGYLTLRWRSVWPAVLLHYANNLTYFLR